jgi:hypothetical protein
MESQGRGCVRRDADVDRNGRGFFALLSGEFSVFSVSLPGLLRFVETHACVMCVHGGPPGYLGETGRRKDG